MPIRDPWTGGECPPNARPQSAFIPTAFTPNSDNLNDCFVFDILGATNIDISIFDRWGEKVYENPDLLPKNRVDLN